jgi:GNAT superfamily N-acetyltransferase
VLCVEKDEDTAQLRILLVDPTARGLGIGRRLVGECVEFAQRAGYERMVLWTNDPLVSAARIYLAAGFRLISEEPHRNYGANLVEQIYEMEFRDSGIGSGSVPSK